MISRNARFGHRLRRSALPLALVALAAGCDQLDRLLDVETPSTIPAEGLAVPKNAQLFVTGAIADFECAFGAYVALSGVLSHEFIDATQTASRWPYDRRSVNPDDSYGTASCQGLGVYTPLSTARFSADNILGHLQEWTAAELEEVGFDRDELIATAAAYAGYSYLLLGEGFCSAAVDLSPEMSSQQLFELAEERFTTAIGAAQTAGLEDILNMAHVGRARTRLDLGDEEGALADAQQVPADFVFNVTASTASTRRNNRVFAQSGVGLTGGQALSVGPNYRDVRYLGEPDPRVPVFDAERIAGDNVTEVFLQEKYESLSDPLPLATGDEAQLIIAEVEGGQTAVDIINEFHRRAGLAPFISSDPAAIAEHVIEERRRELWLEGHRFFDIRRFGLPLDPPPGEAYRKGSFYGNTVCLPLPDVERRNNPNV